MHAPTRMQGQTSVLAAVFGPGQPRYSRKERIEGAAIEVRDDAEVVSILATVVGGPRALFGLVGH